MSLAQFVGDRDRERHMLSTLPSRWTSGPVRGAPDASGHVRMWTTEDARRLATRGEVEIPGYSKPFRVRSYGCVVRGFRCADCGQEKVITTAAAGTWCYGCGGRA